MKNKVRDKTQNNITCDADSDFNDVNSCIAVKLENSNTRQEWVICPILSCMYCWISIHPDQLQPNYGNIDPMLLISNMHQHFPLLL